MKRLVFLLSLVIAASLAVFFLRPALEEAPSQASNVQLPPGTKVSDTDTNVAAGSEDADQSISRVIGGVDAKGVLITEKLAGDSGKTESEAQDGFVIKVISEKWLDAEGKAGRRRVRVVEADFKYSRIRLEEEVWTDPKTGKKTVKRINASVADHLLVGLKKDVDVDAATAVLESHGYRVRSVEDGSFLLAELVEFDTAESQQISIDKIDALEEFIDYAEPDYLVYPSVIPNDPAFSSRKMWGLDNPGDVAGTIADADIDAPEGWEVRSDASNVIVAVTDTGIRYTHEDLVSNMWENADEEHGYDAYDNDNDPMDISGHGTHCAGTIGAQGNNGKGIVGVAWDVQLMALRFLGPNGGTTSDAIRVINYARLNGAHVISASWGGGGFSRGLREAINACYMADIPFVAAAGNDSSNTDAMPHYPSSYDVPNIVSVASTDGSDKLSYFSNYGAINVDLAAPGGDIWSCGITSDSSYRYLSGTSMATPHVAGALALARAQFPSESAEDHITRLYTSVDQVEALTGKVYTGGRLNLLRLFSSSSAAVYHDDFEKPLWFGGCYGYWCGNNGRMTREVDEDSFSPDTGQKSLWFAWEAPSSGLLRFKGKAMKGDVSVVAFEGNDRTQLKRIADNFDERVTGTSYLYFYVEQGKTYRFSVDSRLVQGQVIIAELVLRPDNDMFLEARELLSGDRFSDNGTNCGATAEDFEKSRPHAGVGKGKSVWWKWTADFDGEFVITTQGSEFDTVLAVYTGSPRSLTEVMSNDDRNAMDWTSQVKFNVTSGTTYYIAVDGYRGDAQGEVVLNGFKYGELVILKQPEDVMAVSGTSVDFSVIGMSHGKLQYQWFKDDQALAGVNTDTLHINRVSSSDIGNYHVVISSGEESVKSQDAALGELRFAPQIIWMPRAMAIATGDNLLIQPRITGSEPLTYQWFKDGVLLSGETSNALQVVNLQTSHQGYYHLEINNDMGSAQSTLINVSVMNVPWASWSYTYSYPQGYDIYDIKYANGQYVVVGDAGTIVSSPDAVTWKIHSLGLNDFRFKRVAHGNGIWLAADASGHLAWSDDMEVWKTKTESTLGTGISIFDLFFWNGKFNFMMRDGADSKLYTSTDAETWTLSKEFSGKYYNDALTSPTELVLIEIGSDDVLTTSDGSTWTRTTVVPDAGFPALNVGIGLYKEGEFKVWSTKGYTNSKRGVWISSDGISWQFTDHTDQGASGNYWPGLRAYENSMAHRLVYANGMYYWIEQGWKFFHASKDDLSWDRYTMNFEVNAVTSGPGGVVIAGDDGVTSKAAAVSGLYGSKEFSSITPDERFTQLKVVHGLAWASTSAGRFFTSSDGASWTASGSIVELGSLTYANGQYWCGGQGLSIGGTVYKIFRGDHPTALAEVQECDLTSISVLAHNGTKFVAVSTAAPRGFYCSVDGIHWTASAYALGSGVTIKKLDHSGGLFIALDGDGNIYSSSDGESWNKYSTGVGYSSVPIKLAYGVSTYFAIGGSGGLWYSSDGIAWSYQNLARFKNPGPANVSVVADDEGVAIFINNIGIYSINPSDHNSWYQFNLPVPSLEEAANLAGSVIGLGGYGSLSILQGGNPTSFAPIGRFKNVLNGGRYLIHNEINIQTESFDPEGGAIDTSFWIDGVKVADSTENNPEFPWYPTAVGNYNLKLEVTDATGIRTEHLIHVEIQSSSIIKNQARLTNATAMIQQGGEIYLGGGYGRFSTYKGQGSYGDIALPTNSSVSSMVYAKGVNVVGGGEVLVSSDGFNWDLMPGLSGRVGFDNGLFFVVGDKKLHLSDDGYHWETVTNDLISTSGSVLFYQDGKIVIAGNREVIVSRNRGKSWEKLGLNTLGMLRWKDKLLVTTATELYETEDVEIWTKSDLPVVGGYLGSILHEAGGLLFLGRPSSNNMGGFDLLYTSSDAVQWTPVAGAGICHDIEYGNNMWVSFGSAAAYRSLDGINWELILGSDSNQSVPVETPLSGKYLGSKHWNVEYHNDIGFIALGYTWYDVIYATSPDGEAWALELGEKLTNNDWSQIAIQNGYTCIYQAGKLKGSDDFQEWEIVSNQPSASVVKIKALNGSFVCITERGDIGFSDDGRDWVYSPVETGAWLRDVAYRNGRYVVVAAGGINHAVDRVYVSMDQTTWVKVDLPSAYQKITVDESQFILYDHQFTWFATSSDGLTWSETKLNATDLGLRNIKSMTYGAGGYLLTDENYGISKGAFTTDFLTWTPVLFSGAGTIPSVSYRPSSGFTALNSDFSGNQWGLFSSPDGVTWQGPTRALSGGIFLLQDGEDTYVASAYAVEVMSQQDLEIVSIKIPSGEFGVGDVVQAEIVIKNHSDAEVSSDDLSFEFVASKDPVLGNGDDYLISSGHTAQEAVLANSTVTTSIEFVIPADATAGSVYVGVYAQLPSNYYELNKANNIQRTESAVLNIPEWELNLVTLGNGQVNQDFAAVRYPHKARVSLTANAGKGAAFAGWGGDAIGGESQITILMDGNKSVQANFSSRATLQVLTRGNGVVAGVADLGSYAVGATANLTATPADGWEFSGWSGAATGSDAITNITMDAPKAVTATFVLPVANWRSQKFSAAELDDAAISGDDADPDQDGLKNWQEYLHGSDPKSAASKGVRSLKVEGGWLYVIYTRNAGPEGARTLFCQATRDMADWNAADLQERILRTDDGIETVEARIPISGGSKGFLRLKYSR